MSFVQFFQQLLRSPATRDLGLELLAIYGLRPLPVPSFPADAPRRSA